MYVPHTIVPYGHRYARGQTCPTPFAPLFQHNSLFPACSCQIHTP
ncbi:hypothetical protein IEO21_08194 [Rhodonia placenta]|uniref:Uncharacterized protein n=1 Tax=Rhodonia placenta TaxID=104341 RepID=A0A8H7NWN9_9APHY|nr:hypothetical protein IEO21_08194 [Postia placenta]